jgi:hypothetical protein
MGCAEFLLVVIPLSLTAILVAVFWFVFRRNPSPRLSGSAQAGSVPSASTRQPQQTTSGTTLVPTASAPVLVTRELPTAMDGYGYLAVVGESNYQPALLRVLANRGRMCWARLVPEPDNPFDRNAVMVEIDGHTVGYFARADALRYQRRLLPLAEPIQVPAKLIGGTDDKPSIGVLLDHREVEALPTPKRARKRKPEIPPDDQPF